MMYQLNTAPWGGSLLVLAMFLSLQSLSQTSGSFVDNRDGQVYETVTYSFSAPLESISDVDEYGKYVHGEPMNYVVSLIEDTPKTFTWMAQELNFEIEESKCKYDSDSNCDLYGRLYTWYDSKSVCPGGWHLPSDDEWFMLAHLYGGVNLAGEHLKNTSLAGTNSSLFNVKKPSIFWSTAEIDSTSAMDWKVNYRWKKLQRWKGGKNLYNSVRCVQDY